MHLKILKAVQEVTPLWWHSFPAVMRKYNCLHVMYICNLDIIVQMTYVQLESGYTDPTGCTGSRQSDEVSTSDVAGEQRSSDLQSTRTPACAQSQYQIEGHNKY
jgi:hypothetical protein